MKQPTVAGIDVSKNSVSVCVISERPDAPRQFFYEAEFEKLYADAEGIKRLLALKPAIAVMEPTGTNYSRLWGTHLARQGCEVWLAPHNKLRSYRANALNLPDKDDDADALALACYWFDHHRDPYAWAQVRQPKIAQLRKHVLRLAHLSRVQSPIINRARQDMAWQFPEAAHVKSVRTAGSDRAPLLWAWIAGERKSAKYDRMLAQSVGLGIEESLIDHARRICGLQQEEARIEREIAAIVRSSPEFLPYRQVFADFGFGLRTEALILSQIYPLEAYLGPDGRPEVKIRKGRISGKPTKRRLSERRFQKALGVAPTSDSSGDKQTRAIVGGSDLCRKGLWLWLLTRIEPKQTRLANPIGQLLGERLEQEKATKPARLARSRVSAYAARLLFRRLVAAIAPE
ncbi:MAG: transposase [Cyanobacteria bacterium]|nr:transposase [Cyanobacteriota bacterium]